MSQDKQSKHRETLDTINQQIKKVEETINHLLEDIDISQIIAAEKLHLAVKFMAQHIKLMVLKESIQRGEHQETEKQEATFMLAFQRHLRGERPGESDGS
jgi:hypothetical protein